MATTTEKSDKKAPKIPALRVTSRRDGFRRAGLVWSSSPIELPASNFTAEQIEALRSEPMLIIEDIELDATSADGDQA